MRIGAPYNKGDAYESKIEKIMKKRKIMPPGFNRAGAGGSDDAVFIHNGKKYCLEVKKDLLADYGQRMITWNEDDGWHWSKDDEVTKLYDNNYGLMGYLRKKGITPNKHRIPNGEITLKQKKEDQANFEDTSRKVNGKALLDLYKIKNTYYMQVGDGYGFYSLANDPADLGAPQFWTSFILRLRAKTIHSKPISNYAFYAVLKVDEPPKPSRYNIESEFNQAFPPIAP